MNLKVVNLMLKKFGIVPDLCLSGILALELLEKIDYDLIFLDIQMPEMDGPTTLLKVKELYPHFKTPVVALTANILPEDRAKYKALGMEYFLSKPIIKEELYSLLNHAFVL